MLTERKDLLQKLGRRKGKRSARKGTKNGMPIKSVKGTQDRLIQTHLKIAREEHSYSIYM